MQKIKKILFLAAIFFGTLIYHNTRSTHEETQNNISLPALYQADKILNPTLVSLLQALSINHENTLQSIVDSTQKAWLRKAGQERWDLASSYSPELSAIIIDHCAQLNMINKIMPTKTHYNYALVMGATLDTIRNRFAFLINLIHQGITFDSIVLLTGQRPLDPILESSEKLMHPQNSLLPLNLTWKPKDTLPSNETEMIQMVIDQTDINNITAAITVTDTPCKVNSSGALVRPTTGDTFASWLKNDPLPGSVLVISSQPYVGYQDMVARTFLPQTFTIETCGCAHKEPLIDTDLLDTLARWIYQTKLYLAKQ